MPCFPLGQSQICGLLATPEVITFSGVPSLVLVPKPFHVSIAPVGQQSYKQWRNLHMSLKLELNINQQTNMGRCQGCLRRKLAN